MMGIGKTATAWSVVMICCCGTLAGAADPYLGQPLPGVEPQLFAPGIVSTGLHEITVSAAPDGASLLVTRADLSWFSIIVQVQMCADGSPLVTVPSYAGEYSDSYAAYAPDGATVYFNSNRPEPGADGVDVGRGIWSVAHTSSGWGEPRHLGPAVHVADYQTCPSVTADGALYFHAWIERDGGQDADLFVSRPVDGVYGAPVPLGDPINTPGREFHPWISPDGGLLLFDAQGRDGGLGANDLYLAVRRADGSWSEARNLGPSINTAFAELRPRLSPDGKVLFFTSNRVQERTKFAVRLDYAEASKALAGAGNGSQDIYWVHTAILEPLLAELR
ncbi:MAG: hypothetical protein GY838_02375 [bacterium]|nr:hypothetical protein [bacterium]